MTAGLLGALMLVVVTSSPATGQGYPLAGDSSVVITDTMTASTVDIFFDFLEFGGCSQSFPDLLIREVTVVRPGGLATVTLLPLGTDTFLANPTDTSAFNGAVGVAILEANSDLVNAGDPPFNNDDLLRILFDGQAACMSGPNQVVDVPIMSNAPQQSLFMFDFGSYVFDLNFSGFECTDDPELQVESGFAVTSQGTPGAYEVVTGPVTLDRRTQNIFETELSDTLLGLNDFLGITFGDDPNDLIEFEVTATNCDPVETQFFEAVPGDVEILGKRVETSSSNQPLIALGLMAGATAAAMTLRRRLA